MKKSFLTKGLAALLGAMAISSSALVANAEEPRELTIGFYVNAEMPTDLDAVIDKLNEYLLEKCNAKITDYVIMNYSNYLDQINLILAGDEKLDLFLLRGSNYYMQYQSRGQLLALDDLLAEYGTGVTEAVGDFMEGTVVGGETFGVPTIRDMAKQYGFVMAESVVEENGIDLSAVETMDDMVEVFETIKENEPNMTPWKDAVGANVMMEYSIGIDSLSDYIGVLMNEGQDDELTVVNYFETEEYAEWCNYMHDLYEKGYIAKDFLTNTDSSHDLLRAHTAFSMSTGLKPGFDVQESTVIAEPAVSVGLTDTYTTTGLVQTAMWCIPHNSTEPEAAMEMLNLMYSDEYFYNLITWGIEGQHYEFKEDGHIGFPEGVTSENSGYSLGLGWIFGNQYLSYVWEGDDLDVYDQLKEFNESATKSKALGFTYDSTPVKTEVAAVTSVMNEYRAGLEYGVLDPETALPEFIDKLKAAGIDTVIEEKQKQLDEWVASK